DPWQDAQHSAEFRQSRHREGQRGRSRNHPGNNAAGLTDGIAKETSAHMRSVGGASGEVDFFA
ncbi:MAG: hypothetical protein KFF50_06140, partial [Desulfatitalea sp.]|nr:hypothetical protein [Desulfatitalea sp.]